MKVIFWGTPAISVPYLEFLSRTNEVVAVVTQTDKPSSRGQKVKKTPVKIFAEERKIPVFQPSVLKDGTFIDLLSRLKPEVGIAVAYGRILPREIIQIFPNGIYNIHFSLLPHLRGAAPMQWAILRGERKTGVTSFRIAESVDTGNILIQKPSEILPTDNAVTLEEKLIPLGVLALEETMKKIRDGQTEGIGQTGEASYAPPIKKKDAKIDWRKSAKDISLQVRALVRLGAFCHLPDGKIIKIYRAETASSFHQSQGDSAVTPGILCGTEKNRGFLVSCGVGALLVLRVQMEGKRETDGWSFLQGAHLKAGDKLL